MERKVASDYPQELLDLFHEYQHGNINRRPAPKFRQISGYGSGESALLNQSL